MTDDKFLSNNPDDQNPMADMEQDEKLPGDYKTPFSPPSDVNDRLGREDPATDTPGDETELNDAGIDAAAGVTLPGETTHES